MKMLLKFLKEEEGATAIEYGLIGVLIAAVIIVVTTNLGQKVRDLFIAVDKAW